MTDATPKSKLDEHRRTARQEHRRAQVAGGLLAAVATLAPIVLSVRGARR